MPDYRKMYHIMFSAAMDTERLLTKALITMSKAKLECEELYFESEDSGKAADDSSERYSFLRGKSNFP